jgi:hypothetical protein
MTILAGGKKPVRFVGWPSTKGPRGFIVNRKSEREPRRFGPAPVRSGRRNSRADRSIGNMPYGGDFPRLAAGRFKTCE